MDCKNATDPTNILTFARDSTSGRHFIVPDGPVLLVSPAISASSSGDLVGSAAPTATGDKSTGVVTITLASNTYTVNNAAQLSFSLIGLETQERTLPQERQSTLRRH